MGDGHLLTRGLGVLLLALGSLGVLCVGWMRSDGEVGCCLLP